MTSSGSVNKEDWFLKAGINLDFIEVWRKEYDQMTYRERLEFHAYFVPFKHKQSIEILEESAKLLYDLLYSMRETDLPATHQARLLDQITRKEEIISKLKLKTPSIDRYAKIAAWKIKGSAKTY